jgi:hypothetical protein
MTGMSVTAFFNNGSSENLSWAPTSATSGGVAGTGWSLTQTGDTFGGDWTLTNTSALPITRLFLDGLAARIVFDVNPGSPSTPNSASGQPFTRVSGGTGRDLVVTYSDLVAITGNPPAGDLYRTMDLTFSVPGGAMLPGSTPLVFETDTDAGSSAIIVPEPTSAAILGVLGLAMGMMRGRRPQRR